MGKIHSLTSLLSCWTQETRPFPPAATRVAPYDFVQVFACRYISWVQGNCLTSVSDMQASMLLMVAGRLFAPPLSLSVHDVEEGEAMQVAGER